MLYSITNALIELEEKKVLKLVDYAMKQGATQTQVIESIQSGLDEIGKNFEIGKYGVTDLMMAGIIFEEILEMNWFKIQEVQKKTSGTILLCTIESDLHDIGKTIFKSMAIMAGLNVLDIGVDVTPQEIVNQTIQRQPDIIGISSILTEGIPYIKETVDLLVQNNIRDKVKIIIGGLSTYRNIVAYTGVDAYGKDAFEGAQICKQWITKGCVSDKL